jgi:hypothetical protein
MLHPRSGSAHGAPIAGVEPLVHPAKKPAPIEAARERRVPGNDRHKPLQGRSEGGPLEEGLRQDGGETWGGAAPGPRHGRGFFSRQLTLRKFDDGMNASKRVRIARSIDAASRPARASSSSRLP